MPSAVEGATSLDRPAGACSSSAPSLVTFSRQFAPPTLQSRVSRLLDARFSSMIPSGQPLLMPPALHAPVLGSPPIYLNYHPQVSLKNGQPLPTNTYNPAALDEEEDAGEVCEPKEALDRYTEDKGRKSVIPQSIYNAIVHTLLHPTQAATHINPQHRYALKNDPKYSLAHLPPTLHPPRPAAVVLLHAGRQVAVREQLYAVLVACHEEAGHGGRDKTGEVVRLYYAKVTKDIVQEFVKGCEYCRERDRRRGMGVQAKKEMGEVEGAKEGEEGGVKAEEGEGMAWAAEGDELDERTADLSCCALDRVKRSESDLSLAVLFSTDALGQPFPQAPPPARFSLPPLPPGGACDLARFAAGEAGASFFEPAAMSEDGPCDEVGLQMDFENAEMVPSGCVALDMDRDGVSQEALDFVEGVTRSVRSIFIDQTGLGHGAPPQLSRTPSVEAHLDASQTLISLAYSTGTSPCAPGTRPGSPAGAEEPHLRSSFTTPKVTRSVSQNSITGIDWVALNAERERALEAAAAQVARPPPAAIDPSFLGGSVATTLRGRRQAKLPPLSLSNLAPAVQRETMFGRCVSATQPMERRTRSDEARGPPRTDGQMLRERHSMSALANFDGRGWEREPAANVREADRVEAAAGWLWSLSQSQMQSMQGELESGGSIGSELTRGLSSATPGPSPVTPSSAFLNDTLGNGELKPSFDPEPYFSFPTDMAHKLTQLAARVGPPVDPQLQADLAFLDYLRTLAPDAGLVALAAYKAAKLALPPLHATPAPPSSSSLNLPWSTNSTAWTFAPQTPAQQLHVRARTHSLSGNPLNPHGLSTPLSREDMDAAGYGTPVGARVDVNLSAFDDGESVNLERRGSATEGQYAKDVALAKGVRKGPPGVRRVASCGVVARFAPY